MSIHAYMSESLIERQGAGADDTEAVGVVPAVSGTRLSGATIRQSACQSCSARSGCGSALLAAAAVVGPNQVQVLNTCARVWATM